MTYFKISFAGYSDNVLTEKDLIQWLDYCVCEVMDIPPKRLTPLQRSLIKWKLFPIEVLHIDEYEEFEDGFSMGVFRDVSEVDLTLFMRGK